MRGDQGLALTLALTLALLPAALKCQRASVPGKPVLVKCRSPEKETFTCRWEPGSDGGLPTMHRLYYQKDNSDGTLECPDYRSAGPNACFFDRRHASIWVNYILVVVASNALGNTTSEPLEVDVMDIVQPNVPENVTVLVEKWEEKPYLLVKWEPPADTDPHSGWVTLTYQLRIKRQSDKQWEEYTSGKQTHFSIHSLHPGAVYLVQVACKLDHGHWSEWSNATYSKVPNYTLQERPFWKLASTLSVLALMAVMCVLLLKRKNVKRWLLPPIPGPRIRGFDARLLKSGHPEHVLSSLFHHGFPPTAAHRDQMDRYLVVSDCDGGPAPESQKRKKSLILANVFHPHPEVHGKGPTVCQDESEEAERHGGISGGNRTGESAAKREQTAEGQVGVPMGGGYVEVGRVEEDGQEDYSRVGGVDGDNGILLQKEKVSLEPSRKGTQHRPHCTNRRPSKHHVTVDGKEGVCVGLLDMGYVDAIPPSPTI